MPKYVASHFSNLTAEVRHDVSDKVVQRGRMRPTGDCYDRILSSGWTQRESRIAAHRSSILSDAMLPQSVLRLLQAFR